MGLVGIGPQSRAAAIYTPLHAWLLGKSFGGHADVLGLGVQIGGAFDELYGGVLQHQRLLVLVAAAGSPLQLGPVSRVA